MTPWEMSNFKQRELLAIFDREEDIKAEQRFAERKI